MRNAMKGAIVTVVMASAMAFAAEAMAQTPSQELARLFADERAFVYREDPLSATNAGIHDYDDRLPSVTPETNAVATMILAFTVGMLILGQLALTWQNRRQGRQTGGDMAGMIAER